jgi:hypothetical protein
MSAYLKYLKYKNKYLMLKMQIAGGIETAKQTFISSLFIEEKPFDITGEMQRAIDMNNDDYMRYINSNNGMDFAQAFTKKQRKVIKIKRDLFNKSRVFELFSKNIRQDMEKGFINHYDVLNTEESLEMIFNLIKDKLSKYFPTNINNYVDFIIESYLNNSFHIVEGMSSSFKDNKDNIDKDNIVLFQQLIEKYNKILNNNAYIVSLDMFRDFMLEFKSFNNFKSLHEFNTYMNSDMINNIITEITRRDDEQLKTKDKHKKRALKLENYKTKPIYESEFIVIYKPTNDREAKYHGQHTKWCTAGDKDNLFNDYDDYGPLYVIQKVGGLPSDKYQLHVASNGFVDSEDKKVNMSIFFKDVIRGDNSAILFIYNLLIDSIINISNDFLNINTQGIFNDFIENAIKIVKIDIEKDFKIKLDQVLGATDMSKITSLNIKTKMNYVPNLIASYFSDNLKVLKKLNIDTSAIDLYKELLSQCINLEKLILHIDSPLNDVLEKLTKITYLDLNIGDNHLGDSLTNLTELRDLVLNNYNQPLGDSLRNLTKLQGLDLNEYNQPLGNSLLNCVELNELQLSSEYILNNFSDFEKILKPLQKLKRLTIDSQNKTRLNEKYVNKIYNIIRKIIGNIDINVLYE